MRSLRKEGLLVEMDDMGRNVKNQFKYADRTGARSAIVIGDTEIEQQVVSLKDMESGEQVTIPMDEIVATLMAKRG